MRQRVYAWITKDIMPDEYKWPLEIYICGLEEFKKACEKQMPAILDKVAATLEDCFSEYYAQ